MSGCQSRPPQQHTFVVTLSSATPVNFNGHLTLDGKDQPISGTTPAEFKVLGQTISCELQQGPQNGFLTVEVRQGEHTDAPLIVAASNGPGSTAHGEMKPDHGWYW